RQHVVDVLVAVGVPNPRSFAAFVKERKRFPVLPDIAGDPARNHFAGSLKECFRSIGFHGCASPTEGNGDPAISVVANTVSNPKLQKDGGASWDNSSKAS